MNWAELLIPVALTSVIGDAHPPFPDHTCMIDNVLHEARGEPLEGQFAVIEVVRTRVSRPDFRDSVCGVVYKRGQFSWTSSKKQSVKSKERTAVSRVVYSEFYGRDFPPTSVKGATHYLNPKKVRVFPRWYFEYEYLGTIGNHQFFRKPLPGEAVKQKVVSR